MEKKQLSAILIGLVLCLALLVRLVWLDAVPPSLYWEEVAVGYDAYSLLKTGRDHHGNLLPIVALESFGDWKPTLYAYASIPSIALFGLTAWGVRMPALISGVAVVGAGMYLSRKLGLKWWLTGLLMAVSPWLIQFSRAGWESMLATALIAWGVAFGVRALTTENISTQKTSFVWAVVLLVLSMYTYHAARFAAPMLGILLVLIALTKEILTKKKTPLASFKNLTSVLLPSLVVGVLLILPLAVSIFSGGTETTQRVSETFLWGDGRHVTESNALREAAGNTWLSYILYHRYVVATWQFLANFSTHFSLDFLFLRGDTNLRHSTQYTGLFYIFEVAALTVGFAAVLLKKNWKTALILGWLLIGTIPAAVSLAAPHSLRILLAAPAWYLLITLGWEAIFAWFAWTLESSDFPLFIKKQSANVIALGLTFVYLLFFMQFFRYYIKVYPVVAAGEWQYGYQEMVTKVSEYASKNPQTQIIVSREVGRPAMYFWFYGKVDPVKIQQLSKTSSQKDQSELLSFDEYQFVRDSSEAITVMPQGKKTFFVGPASWESSLVETDKLDEIKTLDGSVAWVLLEKRN